MTSLTTRLRRGEGPVWGRLKRLASAVLTVHIPASGAARPLFKAVYGVHVLAREGVIWALRFFYHEPLFRSQCAEVGLALRIEQLPYILGRGRIELGSGVRLSGKSSFLFGNQARDEPRIALGDGTFVGHGCSIQVAGSVVVGKHCLLAGEVVIADNDGHPLDACRRRAGEPVPPSRIRPVTIGDDVWIGRRAMILKGVTIGDRSIIGAGAVVVRDVPPDSVVVGNPSRVVKSLTLEPSGMST